MAMINEMFNEIEKHLTELGISGGASSCSEEILARIEDEYGIDFPEIYKVFIHKYGHSNVEHDVCYRPIEPSHWTDKDGLNAFGSFFGFEEGVDHLEGNIQQYYERIPDSIVPIADDNAGNLICMGIRGDREGKIFFWDHETEITARVMLGEKEYESVSVDDYWENVSLIAESFFDFIKSLELEKREASAIESSMVEVKISDNLLALIQAAKVKNRNENN